MMGPTENRLPATVLDAALRVALPVGDCGSAHTSLPCAVDLREPQEVLHHGLRSEGLGGLTALRSLHPWFSCASEHAMSAAWLLL